MLLPVIACPAVAARLDHHVHERCSERAIRITLSLAFLAPAIVRAAVEGRLPYGLTA